MNKRILIKPVITEKSGDMMDNLNQYVFVVDSKANKVEIKKAVEAQYNVTVDSVNTLVMPKKVRSRMTRAGLLRGRVSSFKKAVITLPEGEDINFYGDA